MMTITPAYILAEAQHRLEQARQAYDSIRDSAEVFGITRDEYCLEYIEQNFPPLVWTSSGTTQ